MTSPDFPDPASPIPPPKEPAKPEGDGSPAAAPIPKAIEAITTRAGAGAPMPSITEAPRSADKIDKLAKRLLLAYKGDDLDAIARLESSSEFSALSSGEIFELLQGILSETPPDKDLLRSLSAIFALPLFSSLSIEQIFQLSIKANEILRGGSVEHLSASRIQKAMFDLIGNKPEAELAAHLAQFASLPAEQCTSYLISVAHNGELDSKILVLWKCLTSSDMFLSLDEENFKKIAAEVIVTSSFKFIEHLLSHPMSSKMAELFDDIDDIKKILMLACYNGSAEVIDIFFPVQLLAEESDIFIKKAYVILSTLIPIIQTIASPQAERMMDMLKKKMKRVIQLRSKRIDFITQILYFQSFSSASRAGMASVVPSVEKSFCWLGHLFIFCALEEFAASDSITPAEKSQIQKLIEIMDRSVPGSLIPIENLPAYVAKMIPAITEDRPLLVPAQIAGVPDHHIVQFELKRLPDGKFSVLVYNSGAGIERHRRTIKGDGKTLYYPYMISPLDALQLANLFSKLSEISSEIDRAPSIHTYESSFGLYYDYFDTLSPTRGIDPSNTLRGYQTQGEIGNCGYKSVGIWLHSQLEEGLYRKFKIAAQNRLCASFDARLSEAKDVIKIKTGREDVSDEEAAATCKDLILSAPATLDLICSVEKETLYSREKDLPLHSMSISSALRYLQRNKKNPIVWREFLRHPKLAEIDKADYEILFYTCLLENTPFKLIAISKNKHFASIRDAAIQKGKHLSKTMLEQLRCSPEYLSARSAAIARVVNLARLTPDQLKRITDQELESTLSQAILYAPAEALDILTKITQELSDELSLKILFWCELASFKDGIECILLKSRSQETVNYILKKIAISSASFDAFISSVDIRALNKDLTGTITKIALKTKNRRALTALSSSVFFAEIKASYLAKTDELARRSPGPISDIDEKLIKECILLAPARGSMLLEKFAKAFSPERTFALILWCQDCGFFAGVDIILQKNNSLEFFELLFDRAASNPSLLSAFALRLTEDQLRILVKRSIFSRNEEILDQLDRSRHFAKIKAELILEAQNLSEKPADEIDGSSLEHMQIIQQAIFLNRDAAKVLLEKAASNCSLHRAQYLFNLCKDRNFEEGKEIVKQNANPRELSSMSAEAALFIFSEDFCTPAMMDAFLHRDEDKLVSLKTKHVEKLFNTALILDHPPACTTIARIASSELKAQFAEIAYYLASNATEEAPTISWQKAKLNLQIGIYFDKAAAIEMCRHYFPVMSREMLVEARAFCEKHGFVEGVEVIRSISSPPSTA